MSDEREFWMVWNPRNRPPIFKHFDEMSATLEAERLAKISPSETFYVLHAIALRRMDSMQRITLRQEPQPPF